jgi:hypothetical protein
LRSAAQKALAGEIDARASKLSHAPDDQFVLASDGTVRWQGEPVGGPLSLFEAFGAARAWHLAAGAHRSLRDEALVEILEALGIAATVGRRITLAERFFHQLGAEPDEGEVAVRLQPLASALEAWLEASAEEVG